MQKSLQKTIIQSTIILTVTSLFTRLLGFVFRIYMANNLGAYKMGLYQLIVPIYILGWSIVCSGFSTTITKLISEYMSKNEEKTAKKIFYISTFLSFLVSILVFLLLFFNANFIATNYLKDESLTDALKIISISFPFMSFSSCVRSYYLGLKNPTIPSINQIIEQLARIGFIVLVVSLSNVLTLNTAVLGLTVGEFVACIFILIVYKKQNTKPKNRIKIKSNNNLVKLILISAIPLTLTKVTTSALHSYENILIVNRLTFGGFTNSDAISELGKLTGIVLPLVYFPTTIVLSIATSILPIISEKTATNNFDNISKMLHTTVRFTNIISAYFTVFFVFFATTISSLLFEDDISKSLAIFALISPLLYLQIIFNATLNGLGKQMYIFRNNLIASFITLGLVYFLVPNFAILGYIIAIASSMFFMIVSNNITIKKETGINIHPISLFIKPVITSIMSLITCYFLLNSSNEANFLIFTLEVLFYSATFLLFALLTNTIKPADINIMFNKIKSSR